MSTSTESIIRNAFMDILDTAGVNLSSPLNADSLLLKTGMDSLGFAILVARLEEELGYDPFVQMQHAVYPQTYGEFVGIYERFSKQ